MEEKLEAMEEKLESFDEILDYLRDAVLTLEDWNVEYEESLNKEINDLFYIINGLECYQDDLIDEYQKEMRK